MRRSQPDPPNGYDRPFGFDIQPDDCYITVGFDKQRNDIPRFLVQLHYQQESDQWTDIARFDHDETDPEGHDVYNEGLHVDVRRPTGREVTLEPSHPPLPADRGVVLRGCTEYLESEVQFFVGVFTGSLGPSDPPRWSPDTESSDT